MEGIITTTIKASNELSPTPITGDIILPFILGIIVVAALIVLIVKKRKIATGTLSVFLLVFSCFGVAHAMNNLFNCTDVIEIQDVSAIPDGEIENISTVSTGNVSNIQITSNENLGNAVWTVKSNDVVLFEGMAGESKTIDLAFDKNEKKIINFSVKNCNIEQFRGKELVKVNYTFKLTNPDIKAYSPADLKTAANDIREKGSASKYYDEFVYYMNNDIIWNSAEQPNKEQYKCNFGGKEENNYLQLRVANVENGITFQSVHALPIAVPYGSWDVSSKLAQVYQDNIVPTIIKTERTHQWGSKTDDIQVEEAKVYPLSYTEMITPGTEYFKAEYPWYFNSAEGTQLGWYKTRNISGKTSNEVIKSQTTLNDGTPVLVWLRTPYHKTETNYLFIDSDGSLYKDNHQENKFNIAPAFKF